MKKGILVVSFGTTYIDTRKKTIEAIENAIKNAFSDYEVRRAFTSNMVRSRIEKNEGLHIPDIEEALIQMKNEGFEEVYLSSLHIIAGHEYKKISHAVSRHKGDFKVIAAAKPLLYSKEDYIQVKDAIKVIEEVQLGEGIVFMGHGSNHSANASYVMLQHFLERDSATRDSYIGTVEGYPELSDILEEIKDKNYHKIKLIPFMVVAGDHATNDMASDEEDSWKTILEGKGYETQCILKGLGEFEEFQNIFIHRLRDIIA